MKTIIFLSAITLCVITPQAHALMGHVAAERQRRIETEQRLDQQLHANNELHIVISVLSAGIVVTLIIGTAVGSKTRRDHETHL